MKYRLIVSICLILLSLIFTNPVVLANTIHLDGVANSGWYNNSLEINYLNILNPVDGSYYYQWEYGGTNALLWGSHDELRVDLSDGYLGNPLTGIQLQAWVLESAGDVFGTLVPIVQNIFLTKGWYEINPTVDSNAYNILSSWDGDGNEWNAYVQFYSDSGTFSYGSGGVFFDDEQTALNYYRDNYDGTRFYMQQDSELYYYINDINSIDNSSGVSLEITSVPLPSSFLLLGTGIAFLVVRRRT